MTAISVALRHRQVAERRGPQAARATPPACPRDRADPRDRAERPRRAQHRRARGRWPARRAPRGRSRSPPRRAAALRRWVEAPRLDHAHQLLRARAPPRRSTGRCCSRQQARRRRARRALQPFAAAPGRGRSRCSTGRSASSISAPGLGRGPPEQPAQPPLRRRARRRSCASPRPAASSPSAPRSSSCPRRPCR